MMTSQINSNIKTKILKVQFDIFIEYVNRLAIMFHTIFKYYLLMNQGMLSLDHLIGSHKHDMHHINHVKKMFKYLDEMSKNTTFPITIISNAECKYFLLKT
jgi:hypothetical protein